MREKDVRLDYEWIELNITGSYDPSFASAHLFRKGKPKQNTKNDNSNNNNETDGEEDNNSSKSNSNADSNNSNNNNVENTKKDEL